MPARTRRRAKVARRVRAASDSGVALPSSPGGDLGDQVGRHVEAAEPCDRLGLGDEPALGEGRLDPGQGREPEVDVDVLLIQMRRFATAPDQ